MKLQPIRERITRLLEQIELLTWQRQSPEIRRGTWRRTWGAPGTLEFVDPNGSFESLYVTTRSISTEGLDFRSPRMPKPGGKVLINLETDEGELQIPATVIHSTQSVGMPITGVIFDLD